MAQKLAMTEIRRRLLKPCHPVISRRSAIQAGGLGLLGLGMNHLVGLRALATEGERPPRAAACIYVFLSGGLAQQDSFDLKPEAPDGIRGEFQPIATGTPGIDICEHLPLLAQRSHLWALVRSLTHTSNDHSVGHNIMLTGRTELPAGFNGSKPQPTDWPSIAAVAGYAAPRKPNNLPPAVVLPETLIHWSGRTIPGQFAGQMGARHEPWFIEASPYHAIQRGAYPEYNFPNVALPFRAEDRVFQAPMLSLPTGLATDRFERRLDVLRSIENQQRFLEQAAEIERFDRHRQGAISVLNNPQIRSAFDVTNANDQEQDRYGRNSYGWSLLMARRLVEAGVSLVQVNLGNNETWDTHGDAFPNLKNKLLPPTDKALSALLDDLDQRGMLASTLIVMAGEFGRTPKLSTLPEHYRNPGRDHWGAVQTVFFAGGGVRGGTVVGSSDKIAGYPSANPQTPENMAATIYRSLGIPATDAWHDGLDRPHQIYHGEPIPGLSHSV